MGCVCLLWLWGGVWAPDGQIGAAWSSRRVWDVVCGVWCGVWTAECGVWGVGCGVCHLGGLSEVAGPAVPER